MSPQSLQALAILFNSGSNPVFMTADQGSELAAAGYIGVQTNEPDPNNPFAFRVQITEAGVQALSFQPQTPYAPPMNAPVPMAPTAPSAPAPIPASAPAKPSFQIRSDVPMPAVKRGGANNLRPRTSTYPFEALEINQSFHVGVTAENAEPWKTMASNVSAANKRSEVPVVENGVVVMEAKTKKTLIKDEAGNNVLDANGKKQYSESQVVEPKTVPTKKFVARRVDQSDPEGAGVRVYRVAV